jgi:ABC-type transporter MlaC component
LARYTALRGVLSHLEVLMRHILTILLVGALSAPAVAWAGAPELGKTESLLKAMEVIKKADATSFKAVDAFFDFKRICADAVKAHRSKFTAAQFATFATDFRLLLRLIGYPDSGKFLRKAKRTLRAGKGGDVVVEAELEEDDIEVEVTFRWARNAAGDLRVYDVLFDGDSLTGDYQNQFGRLIEKKGAASLLAKLRERLVKTTAERGKID